MLFGLWKTVRAIPDGSVRITQTVKVKGKGQQYFINKFLIVEKGDISTFPQIITGVLFGINLFCGETFLGTFDSVQEAINETSRINCKHRRIHLIVQQSTA